MWVKINRFVRQQPPAEKEFYEYHFTNAEREIMLADASCDIALLKVNLHSTNHENSLDPQDKWFASEPGVRRSGVYHLVEQWRNDGKV